MVGRTGNQVAKWIVANEGWRTQLGAEGSKTGWAEPVAAFLAQNTPREPDGEWTDMASTAYQIACKALVALGQADAAAVGARPRHPPVIPALLPRWDDICIAVLWLAEQHSLVEYLPFSLETSPDIRASSGLGPACATRPVISLLRDLGLAEGGAWSAAAETIFWRDQPSIWQMAVTSDRRFYAALDAATATIPGDLRSQMDRLTTITDGDVEEAKAASLAWYREARAIHGPNAQISAPLTREQARRSVILGRRDKLDWLFFRWWRLSDGWLSADETQRGIEIFHDQLAISMRRAVVARLHPERSYIHEDP